MSVPTIIKMPARLYEEEGDSPNIMMDNSTPARGAVPYKALVRAAPSPRMERMKRIVLMP